MTIENLDEVRAAKARDLIWWDQWFLGMATYVSSASKDPSTQVGAVIIRPDRTIASLGYNGFPRGIADNERLHDRDVKYELIVHAEMNAVLNAKEKLNGCTLYSYPIPPCSHCCVHLVQCGIRRLVSVMNYPERWQKSVDQTIAICKEVGIEFRLYGMERSEVGNNIIPLVTL